MLHQFNGSGKDLIQTERRSECFADIVKGIKLQKLLIQDLIDLLQFEDSLLIFYAGFHEIFLPF